MNYVASAALKAKIAEFEGLRLSAYQCAAGVWTIGYGHTRGVKPGDRITRKEADALLAADLAPVERYVSCLPYVWTQGQGDAVADFCFNLGIGAFASSTLRRKMQAGAPTKEVQAEFRKWVYAGGKRLKGLVKRREWEASRWAEG